jgi:hypothetical protein
MHLSRRIQKLNAKKEKSIIKIFSTTSVRNNKTPAGLSRVSNWRMTDDRGHTMGLSSPFVKGQAVLACAGSLVAVG